MEQERVSTLPPSARWRDAAICLAVAVVAAVMTLLAFTPRFAYWAGLDYRLAREVPEYGRAVAVLSQVQYPWQRVHLPMHMVVGWRLLFPVLWHFTHLPPRLLLAMPAVACVVNLWLVAWLTYRRLANWPLAALATLLFAALPWFFVSTAWLGYFDSWLVCGLLVATFVPSRWALAACCLLTPWVDERFLLALPVVLCTRWVASGRLEQQQWREMGRDLVVVLASCLPYAAIRAVSWLRGDPESTLYVQAHWVSAPQIARAQYLRGLWSGYRAGWIVIVAALWLQAQRLRRPWGLAYAAVVLGTAIGGLFIAADMSRTLMMICPVLVLGVWLWTEVRPAWPQWILPAAVVANVLLPAQHVIWFMSVPIDRFPTEWQRYRESPPPFLIAADLIEQADTSISAGRLPEAMAKLNAAIETDASYPLAFVQRAALRINAGDPAGAFADTEHAIRLSPNMPFALFLRGALYAQQGNRAAAIADLQLAVAAGGPNWDRRQQAEQLLSQLNAAAGPTIAPATP